MNRGNGVKIELPIFGWQIFISKFYSEIIVCIISTSKVAVKKEIKM